MPRVARKIGTGCAIAVAAFAVNLAALIALLNVDRVLTDNWILAILEGKLTNSDWPSWLREHLEWLREHPEWLWGGSLILAAMLTYAIDWLRRQHRRRARLRSGLCPACGYDLRASTDRCPECGTPAK
jgi:hypothetical protein